jgi:hypothetical protein
MHIILAGIGSLNKGLILNFQGFGSFSLISKWAACQLQTFSLQRTCQLQKDFCLQPNTRAKQIMMMSRAKIIE